MSVLSSPQTRQGNGFLYRRWLSILVTLLALGTVLGACSSSSGSPPSIAVQSPVGTALSWFKAINENNMPLALAHFASAERSQMEWSGLGSFSFYNVNCHVTSQAAATSQVKCTFKVRNPPVDLQNDTFWNISFQRKSMSDPWLITGYGTP